MLVYPQGSDLPLRGDLLVRLVYRTDLTPIPATVELEFRRTDETARALVEGNTVRVGPDLTEFRLVKTQEPTEEALQQGARPLATIRAVGILASCAAIAQRLQRSVVRENASLGEIYRFCGAQARIDSDFNVPVFAAYVGMVPSFEVARVLQEEAGALVYQGGRVAFRRLTELRAAPAQHAVGADLTQELRSDFLERHAVPFAFSTTPAGPVVHGRLESARGVVYRPRADQRIVNNLSVALVQRRKLRNALTPGINAGARVDVDGAPHVVITAAHVFESGAEGGGGEQFSQLWLGEVVQ